MAPLPPGAIVIVGVPCEPGFRSGSSPTPASAQSRVSGWRGPHDRSHPPRGRLASRNRARRNIGRRRFGAESSWTVSEIGRGGEQLQLSPANVAAGKELELVDAELVEAPAGFP